MTIDIRLRDIFATSIAAPSREPICDWVEANVYLPRSMSARPGLIKLTRPQREILEACSDRSVSQVAMKLSAQSGKTALLCSLISYRLANAEPSMMLVRPSENDATLFSDSYLAPVLQESPQLREILAAQDRHSVTKLSIAYPGGTLSIASAHNPASLASKPVACVLLDEVCRFPVSAGREGSPIELSRKRMTTFADAKLIAVSTPTTDDSALETLVDQGDLRRFYVDCEHCGHEQTLEFEALKWSKGDYASARLFCNECGAGIDEPMRRRMISQGRFRATQTAQPGCISFQASELDSPLSTMARVAEAFERSQGDEYSRRVFLNTTLAKAWSLVDRTLDDAELQARAVSIDPQRLDAKISAVIACTDVQGDRVETTVLGVGANKQLWVVDHLVIPGDVALDAVWNNLAAVLRTTYRTTDSRVLRMALATVDIGFVTTRVLDFIKIMRRQGIDLRGFKGLSGFDRPALTPLTKKHRVPTYGVGVDSLKALAQQQLALVNPDESGFVHLSDALPPRYFSQLTSEALITKFVRGYPKREWRMINGSAGNEAFDTLVAALAIVTGGLLNASMTAAATVNAAPATKKPTISELASKLNATMNGDNSWKN